MKVRASECSGDANSASAVFGNFSVLTPQKPNSQSPLIPVTPFLPKL